MQPVAVVTGASAGIGRHTAHAFAAAGWAVVLAARDPAALAEAAAGCPGPALAVPTDTSDPAAVEALAAAAVAHFGRLDAWVNNAAVAAFGSVADTPTADVRRILEVNVLGYLHGVRAALPRLRRAGGGTIVNVASAVGVLGHPAATGYAMSKFAIRGLSRSLRQELLLAGDRRIRVCVVLPSSIDTPLYRNAATYGGARAHPIPPVYRPQRVARRIVALTRRPRRQTYVGAAGRIAALGYRMLPGVADRLYVAMVRRWQFGPEPAPPTTGNLYAPRHAERLPAGARPRP